MFRSVNTYYHYRNSLKTTQYLCIAVKRHYAGARMRMCGLTKKTRKGRPGMWHTGKRRCHAAPW